MTHYEIYERKAWIFVEPRPKDIVVQVMDDEGLAVLSVEEARRLALMLQSAAYDVQLGRK